MYRLWMFIKRGLVTMLSYRTAFVLGLVNTFLGVAAFYYMAQLVGTTDMLEQYGGDYLSFLIVGVIFQSFTGMALNTFNASIRGEQNMGTLEYLLMSKTPLSSVLFYSAAWSFMSTALSAVVMLVLASTVFGVKINANGPVLVAVIVLTVIGMAGLGMMSAGIIMVTKQGDPVTWLVGAASGLLSGIYFPIDLLPKWLRTVSLALPTTHALSALRQALLTGAAFSSMQQPLLVLAGFCLVTVPLGLLTFKWGFNRARRDGTLAFY